MSSWPLSLAVPGPAGVVPTLLFVPREAPDGLPLVLFGHGAHLSKDDPVMQMLVKAFARSVPAVVAVMDGPGHGERRASGTTDADFDADVQRRMSDPATHDQLVEEWNAVVVAARSAEPAIGDAVAYVGFSMGSLFGLSIVGRLPAVRAAVFALGGLVREDGDGPGAAARNRLIRDGARALGAREVLMLNMTRDEHFPIDGALEVFASIPGPKRMGVWDGTHVDIPAEAVTLAVDFLRRVLTAPAAA